MGTPVGSLVEAHPLSEEVLAGLAARLVAESHAETATCAQHEATVRQLRGQTDADSVVECELAEIGASRARKAIDEIKRALDRIERGGYGLCETCDAVIPPGRLEAIPSARSCITCAGRRTGIT